MSPAGQWTTFQVQLKDSDGTDIPDYYTAGLEVACITDASAPAGESFCYEAPIILPLGAGLYSVRFMVGTIR